MNAHELVPGKHFRVVGLSESWEILKITPGAVMVRPLSTEARTFSTRGGDEVTVPFRPKAFYISRETSVEVNS